MQNAKDSVADLLLRNEAVEDFKQSIDDARPSALALSAIHPREQP